MIFVRRLKMPPKFEHVEGPTNCPRCGYKVYKAEEVVCEGAKWHKKCFGCKDCRKKLDSTNCNTHEGRPGVSWELSTWVAERTLVTILLQLKQIGTLPVLWIVMRKSTRRIGVMRVKCARLRVNFARVLEEFCNHTFCFVQFVEKESMLIAVLSK